MTIRTITNYLALIAALSLLSGCNTTRGIGEDVEAAGEKIEEVAEEAQDELD